MSWTWYDQNMRRLTRDGEILRALEWRPLDAEHLRDIGVMPAQVVLSVIKALQMPNAKVFAFDAEFLAPFRLYGIGAMYTNALVRLYVYDEGDGQDSKVIAVEAVENIGAPIEAITA